MELGQVVAQGELFVDASVGSGMGRASWESSGGECKRPSCLGGREGSQLSVWVCHH